MLHWIELQLPDPPWDEPEPFVGFVYVDPQAGAAAKGGRAGDPTLASAPSLTVRLPIGVPGLVLSDAEVTRRGLPARPAWLDNYGSQPIADAPWRADPALRGRFHRSFPDDLQVLVHDGDPRRTGRQTELCWLRVVDLEDVAGRRLYLGELLSTPRQLTSVRQGDRLRFLPAPGGRYPLQVTDAYLAERAGWRITPCTGCGLAETLDPPSVMAATRFPSADGPVVSFTAHCPACKGSLLLARVEP